MANDVVQCKIFRLNTPARGVIPQISVIMGHCAGGAVYSSAVTDFTITVNEIAHMFIIDPDVIKMVTGEEVTFKELGGAMTHNSVSGVAQFASEDEDHCFEQIKTLLSYTPQNNLEDPSRVDTGHAPDDIDELIDELVPADPNKPYDMRDVVQKLVDNGEFFEVHEHWAQNMMVEFARFDGRSVEIVGNSPAHLAEEYREKFANPYVAAGLGYIDKVIFPRETRPLICSGLEMLESKRKSRPPKKHGNIPL